MSRPAGIGTVTLIETQKKDRDRVSIYIDDEFAFGIHIEVLLSKGLHKGSILTEREIEKLLDEDLYFRAREKAYHLLSYRERSSTELSQRLLRKEFPQRIVDRLMGRLNELKMVDDAAFALNYAAARLRSKGYGPRRVRNELIRKGVASDLIEDALAETYGDVSMDHLASLAAEKIVPRLRKEPDSNKRRQKLTAYLSRRGFTFDQMDEAIRNLEADGTEES